MPLLEHDNQAKDLGYRNLAIETDEPLILAAKQHVEELYKCTEDLQDRKFKSQAKSDFASCYSEMYFAAVARHRLNLNPIHRSDAGPDLFLSTIGCWAEIVTATDGASDAPNSLSKPKISDMSYDYPEEEIILRLTSVLSDKSKKLLNDLSNNRIGIKPDQLIVICINGGWLSEPMLCGINEYPPIIKAVLEVGKRIYWRPVDDSDAPAYDQIGYRADIKKTKADGTEVDVPTGYFSSNEHSHISAVVFFTAYAGHPIERKKWGGDFITIHNPFAINKLNPGSFRCGIEYIVNANDKYIEINAPIRHEVNKS